MATNTTNNYFSKPAVGGDTDTWGTTLNANWDAVDSIVTGGTSITRLGIGTTNSTLPLICNAASATDIAASFSGLVGIGTTSPADELHLNASKSGGDVVFRIQNSAVTSGDTATLRFSVTSDVNQDSAFIGSNRSNSLILGSDNTERMRINSAGNVGIGTTSPSQALDVIGNINIQGTVPTLLFTDTDSNPDFLIIGGGSLSFRDETNSATRMLIDSSGNVGIGTTSPDSILDVVGADPILTIRDTSTSGADAHATLRLAESDGSGNVNVRYDIALDEGNLTFDYSNGATTSERMRISSTGNVGIGTTSPTEKLHVVGSSMFAGSSTFDGGTSTTVNVLCDNAGNASLNLMGADQGTGRLYVGQSSTHGGGIEYNGDNDPATSGGGSDHIVLYRRSSSTNEWTARNSHNSNDWEFRGKVTADELAGTLAASIFNQIYPVGSIYISISPSFNPNNAFTGSWTQLTGGETLVAEGGSFVCAAAGGSATHHHDVTVTRDGWGSEGYDLPRTTVDGRLVTGSGNYESGENLESLTHASVNKTYTTDSTSTYPPFRVVAIWKRNS